jgi:hypothetical protein
LNTALPISLSQISLRMSVRTGQRSPAEASAPEIALQRSLRSPSSSPIVKRVPSTCSITPGSTMRVAG